MFDFLNNNEVKQQLETEKREKEFAREQANFSTTATDDETYFRDSEGKVNLLMWQQDLDDELQKLIWSLLDYRRLGNGQWEKVDTPVCNMKFIKRVLIPTIEPYMTRNTINSHYDQKMILKSLNETSNVIADAMADGYDEYEIKFTSFDPILNQLKTVIKSSIFRSLNGWTKKIDSTMIKRIESMNEQQQQQEKPKGLWGLFQNG